MLNLRLSHDSSKAYIASNRSCDQCHNSRKRCNKQLPRCEKCIKEGLKCTWDRPLIHQPTLPYHNMEVFSIGSRQRFKKEIKDNKKDSKGCLVKIKHHKQPIETKDKEWLKGRGAGLINLERNLKLRIGSTDWEIIVNHWLSNTVTRCQFYHLFTLTGYTHKRLTNSNQKLLVNIFHGLNKLTLPLIKSSANHFSQYCPIAYLLSLAEEAFFHYYNAFSPLFTFYEYKEFPRSRLLKISVYLAGLNKISCHFESSYISKVSNSLTKELEAITEPQKLKPSLDTLQAYLVIYTNVRSSKVILQRMAYFQSSSLSMAFSLGLHLPYNNESLFPKRILLERCLVFRHFIFLDSLATWSSDLPPNTLGSTGPFSKIPSIYYRMILDRCIKTIERRDEYWIKWNLSDLCNLITSQWLLNDNRVLIKAYLVYYRVLYQSDNMNQKEKINKAIKLLGLYQTEIIMCFERSAEQLMGYIAIFKKEYAQNEHIILIYKVLYQSMIFILLRFYFVIFQLNYYCIKISFPNPGNRLLTTTFKSAFNLIKVTKLIGPIPFVLMKSIFLTITGVFLIKHYHMMINVPEATISSEEIVEYILIVKKELEAFTKFPIGYHPAHNSMLVLKGLVNSYNVLNVF